MNISTEETGNSFSKSWKEAELFYNDLIDNQPGFERLIPLYIFIQKLTAAGESVHFRLGTTIQYLVISRSAAPVLRPDQKFIKLETKDFSFEITLKDARKMYRQFSIKDLDDERLAELLQTLKEIEID
jgi:hypothetical protein